MIYNLDSQYIEDLSAAFSAGEQRGRQQNDEHIMAEAVELRCELQRYQAGAYREGVEAGLMCAFFVVAVIAAWGLIAYAVFA